MNASEVILIHMRWYECMGWYEYIWVDMNTYALIWVHMRWCDAICKHNEVIVKQTEKLRLYKPRKFRRISEFGKWTCRMDKMLVVLRHALELRWKRGLGWKHFVIPCKGGVKQIPLGKNKLKRKNVVAIVCVLTQETIVT